MTEILVELLAEHTKQLAMLVQAIEGLQAIQKQQIEILKGHTIKIHQLDESIQLDTYVPYEIAEIQVNKAKEN